MTSRNTEAQDDVLLYFALQILSSTVDVLVDQVESLLVSDRNKRNKSVPSQMRRIG